jgi:FMN phosphatase YigB (HAD superfamily)
METVKPKHIAVDFDNTLAHFEGGVEGIFEIFSKYGVPEILARESYEETKNEGGFNINKLTDKIKERGEFDMNETEIKRDFSVWLNKSMKLYVDTNDFLIKVAKSGTPFSIITVGDKEFQEQKIRSLGITPHSLHIVQNVGDKPAVLHEMLHNDMGPIVYIDDKAAELDAIRKVISENDVITIKINREDSKYKDQKSEYKHKDISSLSEVEI